MPENILCGYVELPYPMHWLDAAEKLRLISGPTTPIRIGVLRLFRLINACKVRSGFECEHPETSEPVYEQYDGKWNATERRTMIGLAEVWQETGSLPPGLPVKLSDGTSCPACFLFVCEADINTALDEARDGTTQPLTTEQQKRPDCQLPQYQARKEARKEARVLIHALVSKTPMIKLSDVFDVLKKQSWFSVLNWKENSDEWQKMVRGAPGRIVKPGPRRY